jgi:hypothetical protein
MSVWSRSSWCAWILAAVCASLPSAARADTFYTANLSGAEEVPANASAGTGFGRVTLNDSETQVTVSVYYQGLGSNVTAGHVHGSAPPGTNAPIVFNLNPTTGVTQGSVVGMLFAITPAQVADLKNGLLYFNIHSGTFPDGEIRGQIRVDSPFTATLSGQQQVPANASTATGRGWVSLNANGTQGLATLRWSGLTGPAIAAHIHAQRSGINGGVICNFSPPSAATGEVVDALCAFAPTLTASLKSKGLYFNIHTTMFGDGEIRGQIKRSFNPCDFDADGRSDYTIVRSNGSTLDWWIHQSSNGAPLVYTWGTSADITGSVLLCPDVDGDGKSDPTIWRPGVSATFWSLLSTGGVRGQTWGTDGDDPRMVGDYDGDGRDDFTIYRPGTGGNSSIYFILQSTNGSVRAELWGADGDLPQSVPDYDGDGKTDVGVRRAPGVFFRKFSTTGSFDVVNWGTATDSEQSLDYDGDGKTDIALSRDAGGQLQWWVLGSLRNAAVTPYGAGFFFGSTAIPPSLRTSADFDGDGRTDVAVWKPETGSSGVWWVQRWNGTVTTFVWGLNGDLPLQMMYWK